MPCRQQLLQVLTIDFQPLSLKKGPLIPGQLKPFHSIQDGLDGLIGGSHHIRILDPQNELAPVVPGKEPVEKGGARSPDVEKARRAGGKPGDDRFHEQVNSFFHD